MEVGASGQVGGVGLVAGKSLVVSGCVGGLVVRKGVGRRGGLAGERCRCCGTGPVCRWG